MIINDLAIATIGCTVDGSSLAKCYIEKDLENGNNLSTRRFIFKTADQLPRLNYKAYYSSIHALGKHFQITSLNNVRNVTR